MGEIAERLNALTVTVQSPDGCIHATVRGPREVEVQVGQRAYLTYARHSVGEFEHQLAALATLAWTKYQRAVRDIIGGTEPDLYHDPSGEEVVNYNTQLAQIEVEATSDDELVSLRTRGMVHWWVHIDPRLIRQVSSEQFLASLSGALNQTVSRFLVQSYALRDKFFGDGLPDKFQPIRSIR